ncbi:MAG: TonB-dependent receptor, partial [Bacteroidia bacterium]|nr:TonB-dependent receptor [Bacteroidia bacterium]
VRFDRFDANQVVLKDPYSLVPVYSAGEVRSNNIRGLASSIPSTIGDKYVVYVDTKTPSSGNINITGFRNGNDWYDKNGNPVTDPSAIWRNAQMVNSNAPGQNIPLLVNDNAQVPTAASFKDYQPDVKVSPRISFSFPISTTSQFFGNYDVLVQRPTESNVAQIDDYFYLNNRRTGVVANPDLKMTQVTDYEIGFRQQIGDNSAIGLIASYREFRNLIQLYRFVEAYPFPYTAFGNLDFSTVKSFRVEYELRDLGNINLSANYALQFAEGTGSNSQSSSALIQVGLPTLRSVYPVSFDTRHTLKGTIDYHYKEGKEYDGPIVNGYKILENAGINFIFNYTSGRPYTETLTAVPEVQSGVVARSQVKGTINGSNLPPQFYIDMNIDKYFTFKKEGLDGKQSVYRLRAFIWVQNILNAANVLSVYSYTGSAYDDGYLASPQSIEQKRVATSSQSFVDLYNIRMVNPNFFALPRLTRLGVSFYF